ncbi:MAG: glutamate synthase domain-containing protein 3 [Planctomycetota bacterium]|jgi:glutamate synthase domain-containing protein 3
MSEYDLKHATVRDLNLALHQADAEGQVFNISNPNGKHSVAVGAIYPCEININGHVGYYGAGMNQNAVVTINGNAGSGLAENMMSGSVRVKGNASQYCAATAHGGLVVVEGDAAARCGISMKGVDIVVGGSVGHMSAFMAQSGRFVICGDAGDALGDSLYEARIYVGGKVRSLGADCIEKPMKEEHLSELKALLEQAGMGNVDAAKFKRYGSARKLYNFNIDHAGEY